MTDKQIRAAIQTYLQAGSGTDTRVLTRWKQAINTTDWQASLSSVTQNKIIDGWYITRVAVRNRFDMTHRWEKEYDYQLWYFRSRREGTAEDNSEFDVNAILDSVSEQLEEAPTLGFNSMVNGITVNKHSEIQIRNIDTIDDKVHVVQCALTVYLTKQPT